MKILARFQVLSVSVLAIAALILGLQTTAQAVPLLEIKVSSGGSSYTVIDNTANDDNPNVGVVSVNDPINGWQVNVALGTSESPNAFLDITGNAKNTGAGSGANALIIEATDVDYIGAVGGIASFTYNVGGTVGAGIGNNAVFNSWVDDGNNPFIHTSLISTLGPFGPGGFSQNGSGSGPATDPFSLSNAITISHATVGATSSFNGELSGVPEPGSLFLLGSGLIGLGWLKRKRNS